MSHYHVHCSIIPISQGMCVCAKSLQPCPTLCDPVDCSLPHAPVHWILQQGYWSGLPCPPPGDLPDPGMEPLSLMSPALAGGVYIEATSMSIKGWMNKKPHTHTQWNINQPWKRRKSFQSQKHWWYSGALCKINKPDNMLPHICGILGGGWNVKFIETESRKNDFQGLEAGK